MHFLRRFFRTCLIVTTAFASRAAIDDAPALNPIVVSATRAPQSTDTLPVHVDVIDAQTLRDAPALTLDDTLRASPAFSLFRRTGSLTANPTAQGVSLRGIGPSGASRSLVLLDGIPLNDPFGGWVAWSKLPRETLDRVEIVHGAGVGAWGNSALGGAIQILTRPLETNEAAVAAKLGDRSTRSAEVTATRLEGAQAMRVSADAFASDGFGLVAPGQRGSIDRAADSAHRWVEADWRRTWEKVHLDVTARYFTEDRGNGTPLQRNRSREGSASIHLEEAVSPSVAWTVLMYAQQQSFESYFTSINAARTAETPANFQFAVPSDAAGGSAVLTWKQTSGGVTSFGADARWVRGETREDYTYTNNHFTRRRFAGGEQDVGGFFLQHDQALGSAWHASVGVRSDYWRNAEGHRREFDLDTGAATRADRYSNAEGFAFEPSAGLAWQVLPSLKARAAAYHAFRLPTLNEYYRPFRVGNVITEANPNLLIETLDGAEAGVDAGDSRTGVSVTGFVNKLYHSVSNVTVAHGPGNVAGFGFIPAGGTGRLRENLDAVGVRGIEASAPIEFRPDLRGEISYLLDDARVDSAGSSGAQSGKRLAEGPRNTVTAGVHWQAPGRVETTIQVRWVNRQYDDDENTLVLPAATTVDLSVRYPIARAGRIFLSVENVFNARVETGRSTEGLLNIGPTRFAHGGVRWTW